MNTQRFIAALKSDYILVAYVRTNSYSGVYIEQNKQAWLRMLADPDHEFVKWEVEQEGNRLIIG